MYRDDDLAAHVHDDLRSDNLDRLYELLRRVAHDQPAIIERVDANVSEAPQLWGQRVIRVVMPRRRPLFIQEAYPPDGSQRRGRVM